MKPSSLGFAAILLACPAFVSAFSNPPPAKSEPPVVPYLCSEGRPATVVYENGAGSRHARAQLTFDGHTIELRQAPTLSGVRYRAAEPAAGEAPLAWSLRGEEAWLTESPDEHGYAGVEREITRCIRLRGALPAAGDHGAH